MPQEGEQVERWRLLRPLAVRAFRLLWLGESVSVLGTHFHDVVANGARGVLMLVLAALIASRRIADVAAGPAIDPRGAPAVPGATI